MNKISNDALLLALRDPAASVVVQAAQERNWLSVDMPAVQELFSVDESHPAKALMADAAQLGGTSAKLELSLVAVFGVLALVPTVMFAEIPPVAFVMWGALGATLGMLLKKHPGLRTQFNKKA